MSDGFGGSGRYYYSFFLGLLLHVSSSLFFRTTTTTTWALSSEPLSPKQTTPSSSLASDLMSTARVHLQQNNTNDAYDCLTRAYALNSQEPGLMACFEEFFRTRIQLLAKNDNKNQEEIADRMGLASLLNDQHRFEESAHELRLVLDKDYCADDKEAAATAKSATSGLSLAMRELAQVRLFRALAAICNWDNYEQDSLALAKSVQQCLDEHQQQHGNGDERFRIPVLHPFESLKWSCINLPVATSVASLFAKRAMLNGNTQISHDTQQCLDDSHHKEKSIHRISPNQFQYPTKPIKLGYISPDFTGTHPLAFLMQDVFRFHNQSQFELHIYSLGGNDDARSPEVAKIRNAPIAKDRWKVFPAGASPAEIASFIHDNDQLDILVDLCGYAGTSVVAEVMAHRVSPVQVSYMGFPGSSGAPYLDYMVVDPIVVPPHNNIRQHYTEQLLYMPHCYFVNSHRHAVKNTEFERTLLRGKYNLPPDGFVFCCHNRPDKIDPSTFRFWLGALKQIREEKNTNAVLWLLKSGDQMEVNLRELARKEFQLDEHCLVFAEVAPREEHLERLSLADLFLDTPAYNAHTVGCDALYAGVPMLSLLRPLTTTSNGGDTATAQCGQIVLTEKLASRVGASLLTAAGLEEMIVPDMQMYQQLMIRCATDSQWFSKITEKLAKSKDDCPLFDTERWVQNLEVGLAFIATHREQNEDVAIVDGA